jgi:hypothetical protein
MKNLPFPTAVLSLALLGSPPAFAWGDRGHHLICEAATHLVKNEDLRKFLLPRGDTMGHLCTVPDIYWKDLGSLRKDGDPAHYLNPEKLGKTIATMPLVFREVEQAKNDRGDPVGHSAGSLWWRANQFVERAVEDGKKAAGSPVPTERGQQQDYDFPYNAAVYGMMVNMGLLGHFVGDASMPFHNTADYDGKDAGHGGIHYHYEEASVAYYPLSLIADVGNAGGKMKHDYRRGTVIERMQRLSQRAVAEVPAVLKADVIKPERAKPEKAAAAFKRLIYREMSDSTAQLAAFWDEIYERAGKPDLSAYRSYRYPFKPDFVAPDYLSPAPAPTASVSPTAK